jgi:hypothetical protein
MNEEKPKIGWSIFGIVVLNLIILGEVLYFNVPFLITLVLVSCGVGIGKLMTVIKDERDYYKMLKEILNFAEEQEPAQDSGHSCGGCSNCQ